MMTTSEVQAVQTNDGAFETLDVRVDRRVRGVALHIIEDDGGFSVSAPTLPGVASQGDTVAEAYENGREALEGVLAAYRDLGESVPWTPPAPLPRGAIERWVVIDEPQT